MPSALNGKFMRAGRGKKLDPSSSSRSTGSHSSSACTFSFQLPTPSSSFQLLIMTFGDTLQVTKEGLQCALDDLVSPRTSPHYQSKALKKLEHYLASACCTSGIKDSSDDEKDTFFALQYTFECNVPSNLLSWIKLATLKLETLTNKGFIEDGVRPEAEELATQLALSLSLIQGVALNHESSKIYLGRKCSLEILLDLLLASRHLSVQTESSPKLKPASPSPPLTSVVLDTLLCILVDSCAAIRAFEEANGTQVVVKILKRAGTPREARMKCLEFLYFYLLDETPTSMEALETAQSPTAPATPIRTSKPFLSATPVRPLSRYGSSTYSFSTSTSSSYCRSTSSLSGSGSSTSSSSSRSTSGSSVHSFSSTSSNATSSTTVSSILSFPEKEQGLALTPAKPFSKSPGHRLTTPPQHPCTPPNSPPLATVGVSRFPQVRSMMMLKKEVDYIPQSPKKVAGLGARFPHGHGSNLSSSNSFHSRSKSQLFSTKSPCEEMDLDVSSPTKQNLERTAAVVTVGRQEKWRTTEEKKELLGTMLGNVDALVEGVRKAGIWGLG